jgi:hypothetical protein
MKQVGSFMLVAVGILALILISMTILRGITWVSPIVYEYSVKAASICLLATIILIPLSLIRTIRGFTGTLIYAGSYIIGLSLWAFSAIVAYILWGYFGLFIGLFLMGIGVVPVAFLAALFKGEWSAMGNIIVGILLTYGTRIAGIYIASKQYNQDIVD